MSLIITQRAKKTKTNIKKEKTNETAKRMIENKAKSK